jgi:hypothetical protein
MEGKDFVTYNTSPLVGIVECPKVEKLIRKNNISSFVDFIRPFGERVGSVVTQDALGSTIQINPAFLRFCDVHKMDPMNQESLNSVLMNKVMPDYGLESRLPALRSQADTQKFREEGINPLCSSI